MDLFQTRSSLRDKLYEYMPRPDTGQLWLDIFFLLLIGGIQFSLLHGSSINPFAALDLLTPWLVVSFIRMSLLPSMFLALIAAFMQETHSSVPAGFFISIYCIILTVIHPIKPTLSWKHDITRLVTLVLAQLLLVISEMIILWFLVIRNPFSLALLLEQFFRIVVAAAFGLWIYDKREKYERGRAGS